MGGPKPKRKCEITETSKPVDLNKTGYNEEPAKYMANPEEGFNNALARALNKKEKAQ